MIYMPKLVCRKPQVTLLASFGSFAYLHGVVSICLLGTADAVLSQGLPWSAGHSRVHIPLAADNKQLLADLQLSRTALVAQPRQLAQTQWQMFQHDLHYCKVFFGHLKSAWG